MIASSDGSRRTDEFGKAIRQGRQPDSQAGSRLGLLVPRGPRRTKYIDERFNFQDDRGHYREVALTGSGKRDGDSGRPWRGYDPTARGRHWQPASYLYDKFRQLTGDDLESYPLLERLDKLDHQPP